MRLPAPYRWRDEYRGGTSALPNYRSRRAGQDAGTAGAIDGVGVGLDVACSGVEVGVPVAAAVAVEVSVGVAVGVGVAVAVLVEVGVLVAEAVAVAVTVAVVVAVAVGLGEGVCVDMAGAVCDGVVVRVVVRSPRGRRRDEAFFCTDL